MISDLGEVKLTDFGISRAAFQMEEQHQVIRGKYAYMAPEQVAGRPLTGQTDIFALTIVLFELLTGRRLFKAKEKAQTLNNVRNAEVPSLHAIRNQISYKLEDVVLKGLAKNLNERYPTALKMLEALSQVIVEENHRATNSDLAQFIRDLEHPISNTLVAQNAANVLPQTVVVVALEVVRPPRSLATPRLSTQEVMKRWTKLIEKNKGVIWERNDGSMLAVWVAQDSLESTCRRVVNTTLMLKKLAKGAEYNPVLGLPPEWCGWAVKTYPQTMTMP